MKKTITLCLSTALSLSFCHIIAAPSHKQKEELTIQNYDVSPTPYNKKAKKINCAQFVDQSYTVISSQGAFSLKGQFALKNPHFYSFTKSHGLTSAHWTGTWIYYQPNGKSDSSKIFGAEIRDDQSSRLGVFKNKYCEGSYRITRSAQSLPFNLPVVS